jgi:predicted house-cleaning noncanonical NTP pyrophosphatase (MazG superfamily)
MTERQGHRDEGGGRLVTDKIPDIIRADGYCPLVTTLLGTELLAALDARLLEERQDYLAAQAPEDKITALANMLEVVFSTAHHLGVHEQELLRLCLKRRDRRGGFLKGYFYRGNS